MEKKTWRIYEVIDLDSGEILSKENRKNYITDRIEVVKTEKNGYKIEETRRYVKHNGQCSFEL